MKRNNKPLLKTVLLNRIACPERSRREAHPPTFTGRFMLLLLLVVFQLNACGEASKDYTQSKYYVDKTNFAKGRPCAQVLFKCLPESQDKVWQEIDPNDKTLIENQQLTEAEYNVAKQRVIEADKNMKLTKGMMKSFEEMEHTRFIEKQAENLEKEFPGFWRDVPKPVRIRWVRRAVTKAHKYGYNKGKNNEIQVIELCARIGLDFDLNPKWEAIAKFISLPDGPLLGYAGEAAMYIDFTVFEKDFSPSGNKFTDWYLRTSLQYLPYPKRKVPRLND